MSFCVLKTQNHFSHDFDAPFAAMWGLGFNASREVLLAIRQANQQRVEHLIGGLTAALRQQREARRLDKLEARAPQVEKVCQDFKVISRRWTRSQRILPQSN